MKQLVDACWRAAAYCLHPRVIVWSLLPLVIAVGVTLLLGSLYWEPAIDAVSGWLTAGSMVSSALGWLESAGWGSLRAALPPLIIVLLALPLIVIASMLLVALLITGRMVDLVARRRFPLLERRQGGSLWQSVAWSVGCTLLALVVLVASIPLWLVPPLVLVLPPLIWGWLTYRVMAFDVLAEHASRDERQTLIREHRWPLLAMGVLCGYLGAAPSLVMVGGVFALALAPVFIAIAIWIYTLVFAFSSLWFAHYALAALQQLRSQRDVTPAAPAEGAATAAPAIDYRPLDTTGPDVRVLPAPRS